jgi:hypothetical protein
MHANVSRKVAARKEKVTAKSRDRVEIDYKGKTVQDLHVKELTVNNKPLKRTEVELGSQILMVAECRVR